jgi:uncharacterized protein YlxW (UPF0749 family)
MNRSDDHNGDGPAREDRTRELRPSTLDDASRPRRPGAGPDSEETILLPPGPPRRRVGRSRPQRPTGSPGPDPAAGPPEPAVGAPDPEPVAGVPDPEPAADPEPDAGAPDPEPAAGPGPAVDGYRPDEPGGEYEPDTVARKLGRGRRTSAAGAVIGLLLALLGFALVVQLRSNATDPALATARPEDLVRILSDLDSRQDRLRQEINSLEDSQRQLASGAQGREAALDEARRRADDLGILAGTLPATGPGLQITFQPGSDGIPSATVLDAIEELRGAGAEAEQIAGSGSPPVRVVASTYFTDQRDGLVVDGAHLTGPYTLVVIGDPKTMHTALNIPGGVVDTVHQRGGNVIVQESDSVHVTALHQAGAPKYARPVS